MGWYYVCGWVYTARGWLIAGYRIPGFMLQRRLTRPYFPYSLYSDTVRIWNNIYWSKYTILPSNILHGNLFSQYAVGPAPLSNPIRYLRDVISSLYRSSLRNGLMCRTAKPTGSLIFEKLTHPHTDHWIHPSNKIWCDGHSYPCTCFHIIR
jgi:hypothetical protein